MLLTDGEPLRAEEGELFRVETEQSLLLIEPIAPLAELEAEADARDLQSVEEFTSASRRAERLAWRSALRRVAPDAEVEYEPSGAPLLKNSLYEHISVSHSRTSVAVALSHARCAVDIESLDRNFEKIARRYTTPAERALCAEAWWLAAAWCAKECAYKIVGRESVDFLHDIMLCAVDTSARTIACCAAGEEYEFRYAFVGEREIVVYCL